MHNHAWSQSGLLFGAGFAGIMADGLVHRPNDFGREQALDGLVVGQFFGPLGRPAPLGGFFRWLALGHVKSTS